MKVGAENRNKLIAAVALGGVAIIVIALELSGWIGAPSPNAAAPSASSAPENVSTPAPRPRARASARPATGAKTGAADSLDPSLRYDLLKTSEDTKYEGTGRNIFRVFIEIPKPRVPVITDHPVATNNPPPVSVPPPPPPIPLKFYGFATPQGGVKRIFLANGEDVFIAKEGEIVDRRYKVIRISPNAVDVLDVLSNNRQSIPLTQG